MDKKRIIIIFFFIAIGIIILQSCSTLPVIPGRTIKIGNCEFAGIKGGTFTMGSEKGESDEVPQHQVIIKDFWIGKYEVTRKL